MPAMDLLPKHIAIGAFSIGSELCRLLCRQVFVEIHSERQIQENIIGIDFGDWDCYVGGVEISFHWDINGGWDSRCRFSIY
jgi:hypothetical protein